MNVIFNIIVARELNNIINIMSINVQHMIWTTKHNLLHLYYENIETAVHPAQCMM